MKKKEQTSKPLLAILTPGFPASEYDSSCLPFVQKLALELSRTSRFARIIIISFQYPFKRQHYKWHGIDVHSLGGRNASGILRVKTWSAAWRTLSRVKRIEKDLLLLSIWLGEAALVGKLYSRFYRCRHITWMPGQDGRRDNRYVGLVRPQAADLIAISPSVAKELEVNHGITGVQVVPAGINPGDFPAFNHAARAIDVLGVGNLIPLKNFGRFLQIIYQLKKQFPQIKAAIAGSGPEERELLATTQTMGLQENVSLLGNMPYERVLNLMNDSKIFLHTSRFEGMGLVLLEALYSGCKVVSTVPLPSAPPGQFSYCQTDNDLVQALTTFLRDERPAQRTLYFSASQSASQIAELLLQNQT